MDILNSVEKLNLDLENANIFGSLVIKVKLVLVKMNLLKEI